MRILSERVRAGSDDVQHIVPLFGTGLVGGSIVHVLERAGWTNTEIPYDWTDAASRAAAAKAIARKIDAIAASAAGPVRVSTIWAAGRNGFASTAAQMAEETILLEEVLDQATALQAALPAARHSFHHMSSAGGLFEGQSHVAENTAPAPIRPYGIGKLEQEAIVHRLPETVPAIIYRPSSVYGWRPGGRYGLFAALIRGALEGRPTRIFGTVNTVRDYVYADDIARFISARILRSVSAGTYLLASAKPTSMYEAIHVTEEIMQAHLLLHYDTSPDNTRNMSFLVSALPAGWHSTPLRLGISHMVRSIRDNLLLNR